MLINNNNWKQFSTTIAAPSGPEDYCQEAVNRLMDSMEQHVVRVRGVKPQFHAHNQVQVIEFSTREGRKFYDESVERFEKRKAKAQAKEASTGRSARAEMLVALLQFRIGAESNPDRIKYIVDGMYDSVMNHKQAAVAAFNFKISMSKCARMLLDPPYNVPRDKISMIWGGSKGQLSKKKQTKKSILGNESLLEAMEAAGISLEDISLGDDVELFDEVKFEDGLRMGSQSRQARQDEIDRFQSGESRFCFFSFKSGGVGLSLHHTDERSPFKCRRKASGYVYEEDIPLVTTRPRILFCAPTYSAIELVQGLGRCPRLTSLSDTPQLLVFFAGTIEERVAAITNLKLRCLSKVIRMREDWNDIVSGVGDEYRKHEESTSKLIADSNETDNEDELLNGGSDSDEEETE